MGKVRTHSPDKPRIKTQSVKKKRIETKPKKTAATRDAEKVKERKRKGKAHTPRSARIVTVRGVPYRLRKFESLGPRLLPETMFTRKGQTLRQLIRNTPAYYLANAVDVDAHRYKVGATKTGKPVVRGIMVTNDPFRPFKVKRYHETYIIGLDTDQKKPVHRHRKVLVQCTCEAYVYTYEYANAYFGAAYMLYCNGEPPVMKNPGLAVGLCKHLVALAKIAMDNNL